MSNKIGINIKLDVNKIDKSRIFKGQKGNYLDLTMFVDLDKQDQYGNNGFISQSVSKDERAQNVKTPILGNGKVFYSTLTGSKAQPDNFSSAPKQPEEFDDDLPF